LTNFTYIITGIVQNVASNIAFYFLQQIAYTAFCNYVVYIWNSENGLRVKIVSCCVG